MAVAISISQRDYRISALAQEIAQATEDRDYLRLARLNQARYRILLGSAR